MKQIQLKDTKYEIRNTKCLLFPKRYVLPITFIFSVLILLGLASRNVSAQQTTPDEQNQQAEIQQFLQSLPTEWIDAADQYLVRGEILVGVRADQANQLSAASVSQTLQMQLLNTLEFPASDSSPALIVQRWQVPVGSEWTAIAALQNNPAIEYAEPNWIVQAAEIIDTSGVSSLNGTIPPPIVETPYTISDSLYRNEQWYLQRINASRALSLMNDPKFNLGAKRQIVIAVIDSGIDAGSPEFSGRLGEGYNYVDSDFDPDVLTCNKPAGPQPVTTDEFGHGSHVSGLLGAGLNNGAGIASLSGSIVRIEPMKVLNGFGVGSVFDVTSAIRYAVQCLNVNIINMSIEIEASQLSPNNNRTFQSAVQFAFQRNVLQIAAAGNAPSEGSSPYPAAYAEVMGVAALNYDNQRASYSTIGDGVDLSAPGGEFTNSQSKIYSTWSRQAISRCSDGYLTLNGGAYCYDVGTSMAAPLVASVAALVWSAKPELSHDEVAALLKNTALPLSQPPREVGSGIVDAAAALRALIPAKIEPSPSGFPYEVAAGSSSFVVGVRFDNPSWQTATWVGNIANNSNWVQINGATNGKISGSSSFGESSFLTFVISPTFLAPGFYSDALTIVGSLPDGTQQSLSIPITLAVGRTFKNLYLPVVANSSAINSNPTPTTDAIPFRWDNPVNSDDRSSYTIFDNQSLSIVLPPTFTFPFAGSNYSDLRIYSDGFVTFPSTQPTIADVTRNLCLPNPQSPGQAIYAWWANLDPGASGSQVSTFLASSDRFVVEFKNVPTATSPTYRVSFQIVLYRNGDIGLNYLDLPTFVGAPGVASVGVEARDGRFGYLVACNAANGPPGKQIIGVLPQANQSFLINPEDIF